MCMYMHVCVYYINIIRRHTHHTYTCIHFAAHPFVTHTNTHTGNPLAGFVRGESHRRARARAHTHYIDRKIGNLLAEFIGGEGEDDQTLRLVFFKQRLITHIHTCKHSQQLLHSYYRRTKLIYIWYLYVYIHTCMISTIHTHAHKHIFCVHPQTIHPRARKHTHTHKRVHMQTHINTTRTHAHTNTTSACASKLEFRV